MADQEQEAQDQTNTDVEGKEETVIEESTETKAEESTEEKTVEQEAESEVPEDYEITLPEGVTLADETKGEFKSLAKELGLSQDKVQRLIDLASKNAQMQQRQVLEKWGEERARMVKDLKADKEFGGKNFDDTVKRANRTLGKFGSPELVKFLNDSGGGDHKELIKMFAKIDRVLGEDKAEDGGAVQDEADAASILYPTMKREK